MRRVLLIFGISWVLIWCLVGLFLGFGYGSYLQSVNQAISEGNLGKFWEIWQGWKGKSVVHAHALCFAFLTWFIALLLPHAKLSPQVEKILGGLLIVGVILSGLFGWVNFVPLFALGEVLIIVAVVLALWGLIRGGKTQA